MKAGIWMAALGLAAMTSMAHAQNTTDTDVTGGTTTGDANEGTRVNQSPTVGDNSSQSEGAAATGSTSTTTSTTGDMSGGMSATTSSGVTTGGTQTTIIRRRVTTTTTRRPAVTMSTGMTGVRRSTTVRSGRMRSNSYRAARRTSNRRYNSSTRVRRARSYAVTGE